MTDIPPQLVPSVDEASLGSTPEATKERQRRREAEREALIADTHQREAVLIEDTQSLFTHLAAYLKGELSSTAYLRGTFDQLVKFKFCAVFPSHFLPFFVCMPQSNMSLYHHMNSHY